MSIALGIMMVLLPLCGPGMAPLVLMSAVVAVAYRGAVSSVVYGMTAALCVVELIYGFAFGTLSVSFLGSVFIFIMIQRFVAIPLWHTTEGWNVFDVIRTVAVMIFLFIMTLWGSALVGRIGYGYMASLRSLWVELWSWDTLEVIVWGVVVLGVLRRADTPFRRPILFGR